MRRPRTPPKYFFMLIFGFNWTTQAADVMKLDAEMAASRAIEVSAMSRSAASLRAEAEQNVVSAEALNMPEVSLHAGVSRQSSVPEYTLPISGPTAPPAVLYPNIESTGQAGVYLKQLVYSGGSVKAQQATARQKMEAREAEERVVHAELALNARLSYWQAVEDQAALDAAKAQFRRAERLLEDAKALRQAGMATDAEVFAAESRRALAEVQVIRRHAALDNAMQRLRSLLRIDAEQKLELSQIQSVAEPENTAELLREALKTRAELQAMDRYSMAMEQQAISIEGNRKPSVAATAQWDLMRPNQRYFPIEDTWHDSWSVGLVASWNVFDGGRTRSRAASIRYEREALDADRAEQERRIILEVQTAWRNVRAAQSTIEASEVALRAASSREKMSNERYDAGLAPISEVLDAQAELAEAEFSLVRSRAETCKAQARLNRAVGR